MPGRQGEGCMFKRLVMTGLLALAATMAALAGPKRWPRRPMWYRRPRP